MIIGVINGEFLKRIIALETSPWWIMGMVAIAWVLPIITRGKYED